MAEAERRIRKEEDIDELLKSITALKIVTGKWVLYDKDYLKRNAEQEAKLIQNVYGKADVVEVVRCKDCKKYRKKEFGYCVAHGKYGWADESYCSDGERKEE